MSFCELTSVGNVVKYIQRFEFELQTPYLFIFLDDFLAT